MMNYVFETSGPNSRVVECWAHCRLPFDNLKEWQRAQKRDLDGAIRQLNGDAGGVIAATYLHPAGEQGRFDAENVLFYNVGAAAFRRIATVGLEFESAAATPPPAPQLAAGSLHYQRYESRQRRAGFLYWRPLGTPVSLSVAGVAPMRNDTKPGTVWHDVKTNGASTGPRRLAAGSKFALVVTIKGGDRQLNLAAVVKPVFDGIISTFHVYNGNDLDVVSARIAERLGQAPGDVSSLLLDRRLALLDDHAVVHPYRDGVKWNPKDDDCVAGALYHEPGSSVSTATTLEIELVEVAAIA
jgi:hypothetical protein